MVRQQSLQSAYKILAACSDTPCHRITTAMPPTLPAVLQSLFNHAREAQARLDVQAIVITGANGGRAARCLRQPPLWRRPSCPVLLAPPFV